MFIGNTEFDFTQHAYIMGILNVTPDSFSDGGRYITAEAAILQALQMEKDGASILDIGGESTRPGHAILSAEEEIQRVIPIIEALAPQLNIPISIDTSKAIVAEAAIKAGASMINDVWGFKRDSKIANIAAKYHVPCCLMHNRTEPIIRQSSLEDSSSEDMTKSTYMHQLLLDLEESITIAVGAGIPRDSIMIDPGIGFAKTLDDNLLVMHEINKLMSLGYPVLLGTSRKSMIGLTLNLPVDQRLEGTLTTTIYGYMKGCRIFRVHDVKENYRALTMLEAILRS